MTDLRQIARDPAKALRDLERGLGAAPGELTREMERLQGAEGDWTRHIPYSVAQSYPTDAAIRTMYAEHVEACEYCKTLLETLHPSDMQIADFASRAVGKTRAALAPGVKRSPKSGLAARFRLPIVAAAATLVIAVPVTLQVARYFSPNESIQVANLDAARVEELTKKLDAWSASNEPKQLFHAAEILFAFEQPQLAYQEIGKGLKYAGVDSEVAEKVANAAVVNTEEPAPVLAQAAVRVEALKAQPKDADPKAYLELSVLEGKLGMHGDSMQSLRKYLTAEGVDASVVAQLPEGDL